MFLGLLILSSLVDDPCWAAQDEGAIWPEGPSLGPAQRVIHYGVKRGAHRQVDSITWRQDHKAETVSIQRGTITVLGPFETGPLALEASNGTTLGTFDVALCPKPTPPTVTVDHPADVHMGGVWLSVPPPTINATAWVTITIDGESTVVPAPIDPKTGQFFIGSNRCTPYQNYSFPASQSAVRLDVLVEDCSGSTQAGSVEFVVQNSLRPQCGNTCPR
jgi:hypothetical protein